MKLHLVFEESLTQKPVLRPLEGQARIMHRFS